MTYNPNPLYEANKATRQFDGPKRWPTAPSPSPIHSWYSQENKKRHEGKYNEIDKNQMEAAIAGVKNKWHKVVEQDRKLVQSFLESLKGKQKDYTEAKKMWIELNNLEQKILKQG